MKLIAQGAEAKLYKDNDNLIKERVSKGYRVEEIDKKLIKRRTKREAKVLDSISDLEFTPKLIEKDESKVVMEFIEGKTLRDLLDDRNCKGLMNEVGKKIAMLHNKQIIHGDLTTSNFIFEEKKKKVFFIDFGLSFQSYKIEDKAVDLRLLKQALESKHYKIFEECFKEVLKAYENECDEGKEVIERLSLVEKRGRYKKR